MAILLVVLYHCRAISGGYVGVDVFFVISGFLITSQLVRELELTGTISLSAFYARRARRILPAATATTCVTVIAAGLLLSPLPALQVFADARDAVLFGANFHFAALHANYFDASLAPSPVEHYWSLSVEEQFYVFWPLLLLVSASLAIRLLRGRGRIARNARDVTGRPGPLPRWAGLALSVLAAGSFAYSVALTASSPIQSYYSPLSRGWELAAGALIAVLLPCRRRLGPVTASVVGWLGLICIAAAALSFSQTTPFPGEAALLPVLGAGAVIICSSCVTRRWGAKLLLGKRPFQHLGDWSYSWYLWHWPVLVLAPAVLGHPLSRLEALLMAGFSLLLAILSFHLLERPIRRAQVLVRRPVLGIGTGAALVATSAAVIAACGALLVSLPTGPAAADVAHSTSALTPARLGQYLRQGLKTRRVPANLVPSLRNAPNDIPLVSGDGCLVLDSGTESHGCVFGDRSSHTTVVLFGDSHAAAWFPAVDAISKQQHWRLVFMGKAGCPVADVLVSRHGGPYQTCVTWRDNTERQIARMDPALVIATSSEYVDSARPISGVPGGHGSTWLDGVAASFNDLRHAAQRVVYIADVPHLQQPGAYCVSNHLSNVRPCTIARSQAFKWPGVRLTEMKLARADGIGVIDPEPWFCTPARCPVIVGNILVYRDAQHMIPQWSRFLAPVLADKLVPMMKMSPSAQS